MTVRPFRRLAIVNRGEAAVRCLHAVAELNAEQGLGLRSIALHTLAERHAMFVREADEAVCIGADKGGRGIPYLDYAELERALVEARAEAAWVGWGFVAEHPAFAELCERLGVVFVGPDADVMRRLGDKIGAKLLAERTGVPVAPWSGGAVATPAQARSHAARIGYPLMVKASAGGGGRGIRVVTGESELETAFEAARSEARSAFGDARVFLERLLSGAHHVEVQVVADGHGAVWALGVRDCTVQRRNQKVIEESSSAVLGPDDERMLRESAAALVREAGYRGAATVEFLYRPADRTAAFLEVNARLQVEHTVTELTTGADIVKLQLHIARGGRLEGDAPATVGHAVEARLNAEDPDRGFAPAPGAVEFLQLPSGPGVRVDTGIAEGDVIPAEFDSMVAKVMAWGRDRPEALARLRRAVSQTTVVLAGGTTNKSFLLHLLDRPELAAGTVDTGWLDRLTVAGEHVPTEHAAVAVLAASVEAYDSDSAADRAHFYATAARGRPEAGADLSRAVELRHAGHGYRAVVARTGVTSYRVTVNGVRLDIDVERLRRFESRVRVGRALHRAVTVAQGAEYLVEVDGIAHRVSRDDGGVVRAMAPAIVVAVNVAPGDVVEAGASVAVVESMKMELHVTAPFTGRVREVYVTGNVQVDAGAPLVRLEPTAAAAADSGRPRLAFAGLAARPEEAPGPRQRCLSVLAELRHLVLGFDFDDADADRMVADYREARARLARADAEVVRAVLGVLRTFADLRVLSRNRRGGTHSDSDRSEREYFDRYLRSLDMEAEGLPESFRARLAAAARHYGLADLDESPELREVMFRLFRARQRAAVHVRAVVALLEALLRAPAAPAGLEGDELRETLDVLVSATELREPVVGDLARSIRYRFFDEPVIAAARDATFAAMRVHLEALGRHPGAPDAPARMDALVSCPQRIIRLLAERWASTPLDGYEPMLEVLTRRHYKIRPVDRVSTFAADGRQFVRAEFPDASGRTCVLATRAEADELAAALADVGAVAAGVDGASVIVDLFVRHADPLPTGDALAAELSGTLAEAGLPQTVARLTVAVLGSSAGPAAPDAPVHQFTFDSGPAGWVEDQVLRDLHPMVAERLHLWRLSNFRLSRLPAPEDIHLFHCVAHGNPADERFVAVAEVRDLTPVRDRSGRVVALPEVEHVLAGCLDGLRRVQAGRAERRLQWNRIMLYAWPPVEVPIDELLAVVHTLAPATEGLGLEAVIVQARVPDGGGTREVVLRIANPTGAAVTLTIGDPPTRPLQPLDEYGQKVLTARRRGQVYPYEIIPRLTRTPGTGPQAVAGGFTEYDLDDDGKLAPVHRPAGQNTAGIIVGVVRTPAPTYPEGMVRVALFGDPLRSLGSLAEPECRRVAAALDLADDMRVPVEWFAVSAGAKIAMDSGTENLDWVGRALRRIVRFTQDGGEINVVVTGINVGAQPYWNAEATMLQHTRGILVMTPFSAMVLTGKQALDYSGGVSAEDNFGIGGYEKVMGPNGQAQYWAPDLSAACEVLLTHYEHTYVVPGEAGPRRAATSDPVDRDVRDHPMPPGEFARVGDIFSEETNAGRKKAFDVRGLMRAVVDQDHQPLERWAGMQGAENAVVVDARLAGYPVTVVGIESKPLPRHGFLPADGPDQWTAGTLFPLSSKKVARAINAASGNRPVVVLANLSGFDGSPESMRTLQLEYGAEIGRAVVNFDGPIVFCVVSRYHGGAFVVFSATLNDNMRVLAVEGSYASVIGGAPAAGVVFARDVEKRTRQDPRVQEMERKVQAASDEERAELRAQMEELTAVVRSEQLGAVAAEFDAIHSIDRARRVGSVHDIIPAARLRPALAGAVEEGLRSSGRAGLE